MARERRGEGGRIGERGEGGHIPNALRGEKRRGGGEKKKKKGRHQPGRSK